MTVNTKKKGKIEINKTIHRKLNIEKYKLTKNRGKADAAEM
jgi:hypothetical protein